MGSNSAHDSDGPWVISIDLVGPEADWWEGSGIPVGVKGLNKLGRPVGVIKDSEGVLLVADDVGNIIRRVAPDTRANQ